LNFEIKIEEVEMKLKDLEILVFLMALEEKIIIHTKFLEIEAKNMIKESFTDIKIKDSIEQREMINIHLYLKSIDDIMHKKNLNFIINLDITVQM
jgi:hypothetical protein